MFFLLSLIYRVYYIIIFVAWNGKREVHHIEKIS
jgi:hypothetical protein